MTENKRIFLSGALIAGLLLLIPPYLNLIGVSFNPDSEEVASSGFVEQPHLTQNQGVRFKENKFI